MFENDLEDLNPPIIPERTQAVVQMELLAVTNEIRTIELRLEYLRDQKWNLQNELRSLQKAVNRTQRNINNEIKYKSDFVMNEAFGDIIDV